MEHQPALAPDTTYPWTPRRIALGAFIVAAGAGVVSAVAWRAFHQDVPAASPKPARALQTNIRKPVRFNLDNLTVPPEQILFGGPPKDGIPALSDPDVVPVADAGFLHPDDRVVGLSIGDHARAYPLRILAWHEAVNDELGHMPIAVIYCPLCDSVSVVDRRLGGRTYEFGISGLLVNSNVLLFDRTDHALWSQVGLTAISGPNSGQSLRHLSWHLTTFDEWRKAHPNGTVLSFNTGYRRNYDRLPYREYLETDRLMFPIAREDPRLNRRELIIGIKLGDIVRAYPAREIQGAPDGVVRDTIDGEMIVLQSAPDSPSVRIVQAPESALVVHTFWFAWAAFHPTTEIYGQ